MARHDCEAPSRLRSTVTTDYIEKWSWHWWHAHTLCGEAADMLENPEGGTFYACIDFQELCFEGFWK